MAQGWLQVAIFVCVAIALTPPLGSYMARVFSGERVLLSPILGPLERSTYRVLRVEAGEEHDWKAYAKSLLLFSVFSWVVLYVILRTQGIHPFNPEGFHSAPWDVSFNTASSFVSNTNWQYYGGETTLSYFSQMAGLTVQNFVTPAVGICVLLAFIRGIVGRGGPGLGNFWVDLTRSLYYVLLPLSVIVGLILVSQGVVQTLSGAGVATTVRGAEQALAMGPAASQVAIKQIGTNGGGFFGVNSAMPFENPNQLTNFVELLSVVLIPAALTYTYGKLVGRQREGWSIFAAMLAIFLALVIVIIPAEQHGTPAEHAAGTPTSAIDGSTGGNLEGKEQRNGIVESALWATTTTVTSNGSVNSAHDSYTALGGLVPMSGLATGEVVFGGVGTGLYSMLLYVLLAVFIGGLMVGRTPEYLGKKIQAREIKLISLGILLTPLAVLATTGIAIATGAGKGVDLQRRAAGLLGNALRLPLAGQQQRLRLRRLQRLRPARRARQRRCARDPPRRSARRRDDDPGPLPADRPRPRRRRLARDQEDLTRRAGDHAHRHADLRGPARRRRDPGRRPHLLPRPAARPGRAEPDHEAVLRCAAPRSLRFWR